MLQLSNDLLRPDRKIIPAGDYQAYLDAQGLIARAKLQAEHIVSDAQTEFENQKQLGHQEGLMQGRLEIAEEMVDSVSKTVDYFSGLEKHIVDIVTKAVRKVIGDLDDRDCVVRVVRNALAVARNEAKVTVRVCSDQREAVQSRLDEIMRPYPGIHFIDVVADSRLQSGGCILETEIGVVDASVDVQLKAIEQSLSKPIGNAAD